MRAQTDPQTRLQIDICPTCHGIWFDAHELPIFLQSPTLKSRFMWKADSRRNQGERDGVRAGERLCPRCREIMQNKEFAQITLDCCPKCEGLWFDDGEVRMVVERFQKGSRSGDQAVSKDLKSGLGGKMGSTLGSLRDFLKSARE
jgi:Zn-finger nucleic acid-binding protein